LRGGAKSSCTRARVVGGDGRLHLSREVRRGGLELAHTRRPLAAEHERERTKHFRAQVCKKADCFEQLAATNFPGAVVNPYPEPVLDPLKIGLRVARGPG